MKPDFSDVVKRYVKLVYFFAHRWSAGSAEEIDDIVQETFYKALQKNTARLPFQVKVN
jgi:DNA-directed RNA polymerase specialized sigma24 family protein